MKRNKKDIGKKTTEIRNEIRKEKGGWNCEKQKKTKKAKSETKEDK